MSDTPFQQEVGKRRTFGIISHPDAGKTTITEKLLLFGNAIQLAGTVKGKKTGRMATSDGCRWSRKWYSSRPVMQFPYRERMVPAGYPAQDFWKILPHTDRC